MRVLILKQTDLKQGLEEINNWLGSFTELEVEFTIKEVTEKLKTQHFIHETGIKTMIFPSDIEKYAEDGYDIICLMFNPDWYGDVFTPVSNVQITNYNIIQIPILDVSSSEWIAEYFWHETLHSWYSILNRKGFLLIDDVHKHGGLYTPSGSYKNIIISLRQYLLYIMKNTPEYIVMHHTAISRDDNNNQYDAVKRYHIGKGWGDIGYHWFIEPDGTLKIGRLENQPGAHTIGKNFNSIGICLTGNFDKELPTKEQKTTLKELLIRITKQYKIPIEKITNHRDWAVKTCPGSKLSDDWARSLINNMKLQLIQEKGDKDVYIMFPMTIGYELFKITNATFLQQSTKLNWTVGWNKIWVVNSFSEIEGGYTISNIEFAAIKE